MSLVDRILSGDTRAASRLMRLVDDGVPDALKAVDRLFSRGGHGYVVGFTGNPGSGKSTLVDRYIEQCRAHDRTVGVVVVDPTSPFSGGAILGDRIRMNRHTMDDGVFIRSVATRGNLGGMSRSTPSIVQILDAMKFDVIVVETVGVGQDEVDIAAHADTCIVVTVPGLGDDIQASKAGILEVANIFAVNKSDRPEAKRLRRELRSMLNLDPAMRDVDWEIPILETVATTGAGTVELYEAVESHAAWMRENGVERDKKRSRYTHLIRLIAGGQFYDEMDRHFAAEAWTATVDALIDHETTPGEVVAGLRQQLSS